MYSLVLKHLTAFVLFSISAVFITYPLIFHLTNMVPGLGDELLITWIMNWNIHSFQGDISSIFNTNIFYPYTNTLAFSDIFFTSSLFSLIPVKLLSEPAVAFNLSLIFSLILLGISVYLLTFYLTKDFLSSLISGTLVIFSPAVLDKTTHLQILAIFFVPLCILYFLKFLDTKRVIYLVLTALFFVLQTYNSFLPGYFIALSLALIFIFYHLKDRKKSAGIFTKKTLVIILLSLILIVPVAYPYFQVSSKFNYTRDIRDTIHFALHPEDLLYPHPSSRLYSLLVSLHPTNYPNKVIQNGFLGGMFTFLAVLTFIYFIKIFKKIGYVDKSLLFISVSSLLLSLGPFLHIGRQTIHYPFPVPLPYLLFYYLVPGFKGMRVSARWEMLFIITSAVLIGVFLNRILKKKSKIKLIISLLIILLTCLEFNFPMKYVSVNTTSEFPNEYRFLKETSPNSIIIVMPIYNWSMSPYAGVETLREYYSTLSFNKMVNGFSGFSPPEWEAMVTDMIVNFPSPQTLKKIEEMRVDYVIVHTDEYERMAKDNYKIRGKGIKSKVEILNQIKKYDKLYLVKTYKDTYVYRLD